ncbi:hypothetical protein D9757_001533 [Collybiopsis confluens]|uniref:AMP-dependent synthetase/ligase domain-containing protein n=1 Tax=Collybiopsis confluens TaxID=2823264 RepID=A0A8H5HZB1_9AGAR|nr:hypothetical protein D9757_001533 [Collybiopsis confluens]
MILRTHLTNVEEAAARHPSRVAFKIPRANEKINVDGWHDVTYTQYLLDIERFAAYWYHVLNGVAGIPQRSVIAICSRGYNYIDVLHVYGIFRAGYITQLVSLFPDAPYDSIRGIFESANPRAFVFESLYKNSEAVRNAPIPCYEALPSVDIAYSDKHSLPRFPKVEAEDTAIIAQTSGTSSGVSKVVPASYRWLDAVGRKSSLMNVPSIPGKQDIYAWRCAHKKLRRDNQTDVFSKSFMEQLTFLIGTAYHAACVVQPTNGQPPTNELVAMIKQCQINKIYQFPLFLEKHLQAARSDPDILSTLAALDGIMYGGSSLCASEEEWAFQNNVNLINTYGCTESGALLMSNGTRKDCRNLLRLYPGATLKFIPFVSQELDDSGSGLVELVIPPDAPECPDKSRRAEDNSFYTGDLFREIEPGAYVHCGRNGDWINMGNSQLCNTKDIEHNVRELCGDIITGCVVVGENRPSPVLIVESHSENLKEAPAEIYCRIASYNAARHFHERIASEKMIIAVPPGTLPRTANKGTVRRRAVETMFKKDIDDIFCS